MSNVVNQQIELDDIDTSQFHESAEVPEYGPVGEDDYYMSMTLDPKKIAVKVTAMDKNKANRERRNTDKFDQPSKRPTSGLSTFAINPVLYGTFEIDERQIEAKGPRTGSQKLKKQIFNIIDSLGECMRDCCKKTYGSVDFIDQFSFSSGEDIIKKSISNAVKKIQRKFATLKELVADLTVFDRDQIKEIRVELDKMFSPELFKMRFEETRYKVDQSVKTQVDEIANGLNAIQQSFCQLDNAVRNAF